MANGQWSILSIPSTQPIDDSRFLSYFRSHHMTVSPAEVAEMKNVPRRPIVANLLKLIVRRESLSLLAHGNNPTGSLGLC